MRIKLLMAVASSAVLLGFAGQAAAEIQPAPGTFAIQQYVVSQTPNCPAPLLDKQTFFGVYNHPGLKALGTTLRIAHNDANVFHWTIFNNLPLSPDATPGAIWSGGFSGFIALPNTPPLPFNGVLNIGPATTTMTWIDSNTFVISANTTTLFNCQTVSHITGWRTNLNQGPLH
jgi:hypothetical protein